MLQAEHIPKILMPSTLGRFNFKNDFKIKKNVVI
jgi:hypothetical protein